MAERRDENNVPLNDDFLKDLPDREIAERNSVYKAAGGSTNDPNLENLPDRQIAERNSVYKLANKKRDKNGLSIEDDEESNDSRQFTRSSQDINPASSGSTFSGDQNLDTTNSRSLPYQRVAERDSVSRLAQQDGEDQLNNQPDSRSVHNNPAYRDPNDYQNERGSLNKPGNSYGYSPSTGGRDKNKEVLSEHHGPGFSVERGQNTDDQLGYNSQVEQGWGDKQNSIPETVSLDNGEYNGPSKLNGQMPNPGPTDNTQVGFYGRLTDQGKGDYPARGYPTFEADEQERNDVNNASGYRPD